MANHNTTGKTGEALALVYLQQHSFNILHANWRYSYYEIDIIAEKDSVLHFIEVKTRRSEKFGLPEESVTDAKLESLMKAGEAFLYQYPDWKRIQYDILSIMLRYKEPAEYFFIEDVSA